jgi:hypothetical protein
MESNQIKSDGGQIVSKRSMAVVIHTGGHIRSDITVGCGLWAVCFATDIVSFSVNRSCADVGVAFGHLQPSALDFKLRVRFSCSLSVRTSENGNFHNTHGRREKGEGRRNIGEVY